MSELTEVRRERIQNRISKAIIADDPQEKLDQIVAVNELTDEQATAMIQVGRKHRIDLIRGFHMKKLRSGCLILALGIFSLRGFHMFVGMITKPVLILGGLISVLGLILVIQGVLGILLAAGKRGSVEDL